MLSKQGTRHLGMVFFAPIKKRLKRWWLGVTENWWSSIAWDWWSPRKDRNVDQISIAMETWDLRKGTCLDRVRSTTTLFGPFWRRGISKSNWCRTAFPKCSWRTIWSRLMDLNISESHTVCHGNLTDFAWGGSKRLLDLLDHPAWSPQYRTAMCKPSCFLGPQSTN